MSIFRGIETHRPAAPHRVDIATILISVAIIIGSALLAYAVVVGGAP